MISGQGRHEPHAKDRVSRNRVAVDHGKRKGGGHSLIDLVVLLRCGLASQGVVLYLVLASVRWSGFA